MGIAPILGLGQSTTTPFAMNLPGGARLQASERTALRSSQLTKVGTKQSFMEPQWSPGCSFSKCSTEVAWYEAAYSTFLQNWVDGSLWHKAAGLSDT